MALISLSSLSANHSAYGHGNGSVPFVAPEVKRSKKPPVAPVALVMPGAVTRVAKKRPPVVEAHSRYRKLTARPVHSANPVIEGTKVTQPNPASSAEGTEGPKVFWWPDADVIVAGSKVTK
jgi:hypothetical protein